MSTLLSSWWNNLSQRWSVTKESIVSSFKGLLFQTFSSTQGWNIQRENEIKEILLSADLGPALTKKILDILREKAITDPDQNLQMIYDYLSEQFPNPTLKTLSQDIYVLVGVNGAGKTTTAAKLTYHHREKKPLLIAADTYRAAAIEQLKEWAQRVDAVCFESSVTDPSAVAYQGLDYAAQNHLSPVIIDTSGRLQTHKNLMQELEKIKKTILKKVALERVRIILVLDGTQGQNMIQQVDVFNKHLNLSALIITKLDGSSRGGAVCQIAEKYHLPIDFVGMGEKPDQLVPFNKESFLKALLGMSI